MPRKLYVHFEGSPEYTQIVRQSDDKSLTASDLCCSFAAAYISKHPGASLTAARLRLVTEKGREVSAAENFDSLFGQGDLFVRHSRESPSARSPAETTAHDITAAPEMTATPCPTTLSPKDEEDIRRALPHPGRACQLQAQAEQLAKLPSSHGSALPKAALCQLVSPYLTRAEEAEQQKLYKIAATIYEQVSGLAWTSSRAACICSGSGIFMFVINAIKVATSCTADALHEQKL